MIREEFGAYLSTFANAIGLEEGGDGIYGNHNLKQTILYNMTPPRNFAYGNLALTVLTKLGEAWDLFQNQQFEEVKQNEIDNLKNEIARLENELAENNK